MRRPLWFSDCKTYLNLPLLDLCLQRERISDEELAQSNGLSLRSLKARLFASGKQCFSLEEAFSIAKTLNLSREEFNSIFLNNIKFRGE